MKTKSQNIRKKKSLVKLTSITQKEWHRRHHVNISVDSDNGRLSLNVGAKNVQNMTWKSITEDWDKGRNCVIWNWAFTGGKDDDLNVEKKKRIFCSDKHWSRIKKYIYTFCVLRFDSCLAYGRIPLLPT